jgi:hypothetical protein
LAVNFFSLLACYAICPVSLVRSDNFAVKSVAKSVCSDESVRNFLVRAEKLNALNASRQGGDLLIVWSVSNPGGRTLEFSAQFVASGSLYDIIQVKYSH